MSAWPSCSPPAASGPSAPGPDPPPTPPAHSAPHLGVNRFRRYLLRGVVLCGIAPAGRVSPRCPGAGLGSGSVARRPVGNLLVLDGVACGGRAGSPAVVAA